MLARYQATLHPEGIGGTKVGENLGNAQAEASFFVLKGSFSTAGKVLEELLGRFLASCKLYKNIGQRPHKPEQRWLGNC